MTKNICKEKALSSEYGDDFFGLHQAQVLVTNFPKFMFYLNDIITGNLEVDRTPCDVN